MVAADDSINDGTDSKRCPSCWRDTRRSYSRGIIDRLAYLFSFAPYRCRACGKRFYDRGRNETAAASTE